MIAHFLPGSPPVGTPVEPCVIRIALDDCINYIGIYRGNGHPYASLVARRQTAAHFIPGLAGIYRFIQCSFGTASDFGEHMPASLFRRCVHNIRIPRINQDIVYTCILADLEYFLPVLSAIGRFIQSAVPSGPPYRTFRSHKNDIGIPRIYDDLPDLA